MEDFSEIFERYYRDVYIFLLKLSGRDNALAEEVAQETFYQAYLGITNFRGQCQLKTWLFQIAKNQFYMILRKKRVTTIPISEIDAELMDLSPGPDEKAIFKQLMTDARRIIDTMEDKMRDVMLYRIFSDLSYQQIASLKGIGESSAKVLFHRGKLLLRKRLKEEYGYEI